MRFLQHAFAALSLSLVAIAATATPANPQNGIDYRTLDKAQPTESGKRVEVTEFFWYGCDHCNNFDHPLEQWVKKQGDNIEFKRVPVGFRDSFVPHQKLYYALEGMGNLEQLHPKIFNAIHVERNRLDTEAAITEWVAKQGVDKQKFLALFNSFGVQTKARRATQLQHAYQVDGVPLIAIAGRYLTSPSIVNAGMRNQPTAALHTATFQVMDWLVAKTRKENGQATAPSASEAQKKK